jgi:2-dehydro-3-deoxyglucarate aldolase/4-hydroxy-2-oxoheptanedioate aldolase
MAEAAATLKEMAAHRRLKVGTFVFEVTTPGIGHILAAAGAEFVIIDMEHSGFTIGDVKALLRYCEAAGLPTIVRPPSREYHHVARAMDAGAEGIMVPMVGSAADARHVLSHMKYPPEGERGVALGIAHDRYRPGAPADKLKAANARATFVALIETARGIENVDEIAAVPGVDLLWIGQFDLSASLGIPGEFTNPRYVAAVDAVRAACRTHRKSLGRLALDVKQGASLFEDGFDFIAYMGDIWLMQAAMRQGADALRAACTGAAGEAAKSAPAKRRR